jgi:poly-gamma-glutamate capsule biosynthesis protein CapA/YwtB (metallophosphatase superfamily)
MSGPASLTLFLGGDVMTGRGVDQILPCRGKPELRETYVRDARTYVELAERVNGPIPRPVDFTWPWGDALQTLEDIRPDVRVLNLETSITRSDDFAAGKSVHYHMHPANLPCLTAARPDVFALANNHVLDFGDRGLLETLEALTQAGLRLAGAGRDADQTRRPAVVPVDGGGRVVVFSFGTESSGIPAGWAAGDRAGVDLLCDLSEASAAEVTDRVRRVKRPGDVVVASIHWGSNWGHRVAEDQVWFAHRLIDGGVDIIHGHSSHHPRAIEVYKGKLFLYGCGDLIDDYEGIRGHEEYRKDLRLLYFASVEPRTGRLIRLQMIPMQTRRMRLRNASSADTDWLRTVLDRVSRRFGSRVDLEPERILALRHG